VVFVVATGADLSEHVPTPVPGTLRLAQAFSEQPAPVQPQFALLFGSPAFAALQVPLCPVTFEGFEHEQGRHSEPFVHRPGGECNRLFWHPGGLKSELFVVSQVLVTAPATQVCGYDLLAGGM
jgi:hypothetical protein